MEEERGDSGNSKTLSAGVYVCVFLCERERKDGGREVSCIPSLCIFIIYDRQRH